jgi:glyoxylase-like metal-dependent hydrolase (beta-lactamase superfamily II)
MNVLAGGISYIDLNFQGSARTIATAVLQGPEGVALVDPGPSTTLPALRKGLDALGMSIRDVTTVLLTHIHLDHAGATGTLVGENPRLRVHVHLNGAPHVIDPQKLLASAARLYGDQMDALWGEVRPVPVGAIAALSGGERIDAGRRRWEVAYTPGHASHHVCYFNAETGVAFVGDTAGVKVLPGGPVLPPTPPPDIDLDHWRASLDRIAAWNPATLFLTHFGPWAPTAPHLAEVREELERYANRVRLSLADAQPDDVRSAQFVDEMRRSLVRRMGESGARAYDIAARFDLCWSGLARYWRKRAA